MAPHQRRVAVRVPQVERENAIATLIDLAPQGFEESDQGGDVELAVYTDSVGESRLRMAFGAVRSTPLEPGWEDAWRAFHRPVTAGGVWVGPPWLDTPAGLPVVVIDPGRAFGTGAHPTTRLCVELLADTESGSLLDVGCGSGVLSVVAARLGFSPITAVDVDPVAVEVTRANALLNGVRLTARVVDATAGELPVADVAVANVSLEIVENILVRTAAPVAVTSGYLEGECPAHDVWRCNATRILDGWAAHRFARL